MTVDNLFEKLQEQIAIQEVYKATDLRPIKIAFKSFLKLLNFQIPLQDYLSIEKQYKIIIDSVDLTSNNNLIKKSKL